MLCLIKLVNVFFSQKKHFLGFSFLKTISFKEVCHQMAKEEAGIENTEVLHVEFSCVVKA